MKNLYVINGKLIMAYSLQEALIMATPEKV
jgi:hypothetical protein